MDLKNDQLICRAHAKINLVLHVGHVGRVERLGGGDLHPICSWMHSIELCDRIELVKLGKDEQSRYAIGWAREDGDDEPVAWDIESDLCAKAHRALELHVGKQLAASIRVSKSIPAGGGLGGGSSDAATTLMGLNLLFGLGLAQRELVQIAMGIGSDVPYFVDVERFANGQPARSAIVEGVGDLVTRVDSAHVGTRVVLIVPSYGCHTGRVYRAFDEQVGLADRLVDTEQGRLTLRQALVEMATDANLNQDLMSNDLALPATRVAPQLAELIDRLSNAIESRVHVSGSGSTLFVIDEIDIEEIRKVCPDCQLDCQIIETRLC